MYNIPRSNYRTRGISDILSLDKISKMQSSSDKVIQAYSKSKGIPFTRWCHNQIEQNTPIGGELSDSASLLNDVIDKARLSPTFITTENDRNQCRSLRSMVVQRFLRLSARRISVLDLGSGPLQLLKQLLEKRELFSDMEFNYYALDKSFSKIDSPRKGDGKTRRDAIIELGGEEYLNNMVEFDFDEHLNSIKSTSFLEDFIKEKGITHVIGFNSFHYLNKLGHFRLLKLCKKHKLSLIGVMTNSDILADMDYTEPFKDRLGQLKLRISYDHQVFEEFFLTRKVLDSLYKSPSGGHMTGSAFWHRVTPDGIESGRELMRLRVVYYFPFEEKTIPMIRCRPAGKVTNVNMESIASGMTTAQLTTFLSFPTKRSIPRPKKNGFLVKVCGEYAIQRDGKVWELYANERPVPYLAGYMEVIFDRNFDDFIALPTQIHQVNLSRMTFVPSTFYLSWFCYGDGTVAEYETFDPKKCYEGIVFDTNVVFQDKTEVYIKPHCVLDLAFEDGKLPDYFTDYSLVGVPKMQTLIQAKQSPTIEFLIDGKNKILYFIRFRDKNPNSGWLIRKAMSFYQNPAVAQLIGVFYKYPSLEEYYRFLKKDVPPTVKFPDLVMDALFPDLVESAESVLSQPKN